MDFIVIKTGKPGMKVLKKCADAPKPKKRVKKTNWLSLISVFLLIIIGVCRFTLDVYDVREIGIKLSGMGPENKMSERQVDLLNQRLMVSYVLLISEWVIVSIIFVWFVKHFVKSSVYSKNMIVVIDDKDYVKSQVKNKNEVKAERKREAAEEKAENAPPQSPNNNP